MNDFSFPKMQYCFRNLNSVCLKVPGFSQWCSSIWDFLLEGSSSVLRTCTQKANAFIYSIFCIIWQFMHWVERNHFRNALEEEYAARHTVIIQPIMHHVAQYTSENHVGVIAWALCSCMDNEWCESVVNCDRTRVSYFHLKAKQSTGNQKHSFPQWNTFLPHLSIISYSDYLNTYTQNMTCIYLFICFYLYKCTTFNVYQYWIFDFRLCGCSTKDVAFFTSVFIFGWMDYFCCSILFSGSTFSHCHIESTPSLVVAPLVQSTSSPHSQTKYGPDFPFIKSAWYSVILPLWLSFVKKKTKKNSHIKLYLNHQSFLISNLDLGHQFNSLQFNNSNSKWMLC